MENKIKEIRTAELRIKSDLTANDGNDMLVEGYALTFDTPTVTFSDNGIDYYEMIQKGALDNCDLSDVPFKYNHSSDVMVMARTRNKTLLLSVDDTGLFIRANLANITSGKDLHELIKRGDIDKMSFAFVVANGGDTFDIKTRTRIITNIEKIFDVSAVDLPAYESTSICARGYFEAQNEMQKQIENNILKQKLILKTYL
jgi:uncharacterized protein